MDKSKEIAKMIDHSLLHPTLTDEQLRAGCELARRYNVASVCVKPYAVKIAGEYLEGCDVAVDAVVGFPHGNSTIKVKVFETEQAIEDGAGEIDMVVNLGKVVGEDWGYVEKEIEAIVDITKKKRRSSEGDIRKRPSGRRQIQNQAVRNLQQAESEFREDIHRI